MPNDVKTSADMVKWYEKNLVEGLAKVLAMSADTLAQPTDFFGMFNFRYVQCLPSV